MIGFGVQCFRDHVLYVLEFWRGGLVLLLFLRNWCSKQEVRNKLWGTPPKTTFELLLQRLSSGASGATRFELKALHVDVNPTESLWKMNGFHVFHLFPTTVEDANQFFKNSFQPPGLLLFLKDHGNHGNGSASFPATGFHQCAER